MIATTSKMSKGNKSGFQKRKDLEEKARSELSNRPGQLKISNLFKNAEVHSDHSGENKSEFSEFFVPLL